MKKQSSINRKLAQITQATHRKIVVWDLFGGGCNSLARMIQKHRWGRYFTVYTFDVVDTQRESWRGQLNVRFQKYVKMDLSADDVVDQFDHYPHPDIVASSTLCQSFSNVLAMVGGGTCFWKQQIRGDKSSPLVERDVTEFERLKRGFTKNLDAQKQLFIKRLGERCATNSVRIIQHFKPRYWYIENPASSLLFQFLRVNLGFTGWLSTACFGAYGYPQNKVGGFYSNLAFAFDTSKRERTYETQWEDITKEMYDAWMTHVAELKKLGSTGDKRAVRFKDGKYQRRWYVDKGYKIGDKGHCSLKKTTMTLGKLMKQKNVLKSEPFSTAQIGEANETSHIPDGVMETILTTFINDWTASDC